MTWMFTLVFFFLAPHAIAGDLSSAGPISGAGQAFGQSMMNLQSGFIQKGLMEERMKHEMELERMRQEHEQRMLEKRVEAERQRREYGRQNEEAATAAKVDAARKAKEGWERQWFADFEARRDGGREQQQQEYEALERERKVIVIEQEALRSAGQALALLKQLDRVAYQTQHPVFEQTVADWSTRQHAYNQRVADYQTRWGLSTPQQQMESAKRDAAATPNRGFQSLRDPRAERLAQ